MGKKVFAQCNGDLDRFKCGERVCRHHKLHVVKNDCGKTHNGDGHYCTVPKEFSSETDCDRGFVTCITVKV
jgi:hypothetical protein